MNTESSPLIRPIFFALLLANVAFFAWVQHMPPGSSGREPERLQAELEADKVVLVPAPLSPAPSSAKPVVLANEASVTEPADVSAAADVCRAYAGVNAGAARALQVALAQLNPPLKVVLPQGKEASFWVFIPPLANQVAAEKKLAELRQFRVADAVLMQEPGAHQFAISLGLFRNEELAAKYLADLNKRGVRSARMAARERSEPEDKETLAIEISGNADALTKIESEHPALSGIAAGDCKQP